MKKSRKNNKNYPVLYEPTQVKSFFYDNYKFIGLVLLLGGGILYATLTYESLREGESVMAALLTSQQAARASQTFLECFTNTLTTYAIYYAIALLAGLCAIGLPMILVLPFFYGMGIGYEVTFLYSEYQLKGVGYTAVMIAPAAIVFSIILIYAARESLNMSWDILGMIQDKKQPEIPLKTYFKRYAVFAVCMVVSSVVFSFITTSLSQAIPLD